MNIYVGNLPFVITDDQLSALFTEFGEVESAKVIMDKFTNKSKGFGFVEMPSNSEADQAIKALNGKLIEGKNIKVNPANPGGKRQTGKRQKRSFSQRRY
jgi:RNA recognition motif-containing protein